MIDVGGGASPLAGVLLGRGFTDVTVLDISATGMQYAWRRLGPQAERVRWLRADVLAWRPQRGYQVWHDRAVFHFLTGSRDRLRYLHTLDLATAAGAVAVFGCFALDGPQYCSGLPVTRYGPRELAAQLGGWRLVAQDREEHITPAGASSRLPGRHSGGSPAEATDRIRGVARTTIDELLAGARRGLTRLDPAGALRAMRAGAALIDIRADSQIARDGTIAGALVIPRNVLEWRLDPASRHRQPDAPELGDHVILLCDEGYQSSLAAATLQQLGFARATDVEGGFQAWRAAALPVEQTTTSG